MLKLIKFMELIRKPRYIPKVKLVENRKKHLGFSAVRSKVVYNLTAIQIEN